MQTSTAFAPSPKSGPQSDSFAAFLARLAELPDWNSDAPVEPSVTHVYDESAEAGEEDLASLSYEHALRTPTRKRPHPAANRIETSRFTNPSPKTALPKTAIPKSALAVQPSSKSLETRPFEIAEPRQARTTIRFTAGENKLLRRRASENGIAISAYVRSCVLEVESLRAQVERLMTEMNIHPCAPQPEYAVPALQAPTLSAPPPQTVLPAPQPSRPSLQPLAARAPQPASTLRLDPHVQAAFDAQKRLSAQYTPAPAPPEKKRSGFLSFLFGARRSA
jgi:hypothetical protein